MWYKPIISYQLYSYQLILGLIKLENDRFKWSDYCLCLVDGLGKGSEKKCLFVNLQIENIFRS